MPRDAVGDIDIYWERQGSGVPLIFISGTGSDLRTSGGIFDGLYPNTFDLLAYDQRGLGQTSKPATPCSMADYADDAARPVDHIGWPDALVLGVSFGGMVAQELALRHPKKVRRLVLACTSLAEPVARPTRFTRLSTAAATNDRSTSCQSPTPGSMQRGRRATPTTTSSSLRSARQIPSRTSPGMPMNCVVS